MWQFFSRDSSRDFPYEVGPELFSVPNSCFTVHRGVAKSTREVVSIFLFDKKKGNANEYQFAKSSEKRLKTIRHPCIITYLHSHESDSNLLIATEYVEPVLSYLNKSDDEKITKSYLKWGIMSVVKAVSFINNDATLKHFNVNQGSVFVNSAGEWKLGELGYLSDSVTPPPKISSDLRKYSPPEDGSATNDGIPFWAYDSYGIGIFIWEVYNGEAMKSSELKDFAKIPNDLKTIYTTLIGKPAGRPNPGKLYEQGRSDGKFFKNDLIDAIVFMDELHIQDKLAVNLFFKNLTPLLKEFPHRTRQNKVLPTLVKAFEYGCHGSSVIQPLLELSKTVDDTQYEKVIAPFIGKLYTCNDRVTRLMLLNNLDSYLDKMSSNQVNDLFPHIANGFLDTNPRIREETVKAMIHIAPKLNSRNVNEELLKHFARLQAKDDQGGIRTNTTVCLGKIAHCLNPQNRKVILLSAFLRALNDPFPPVRNSGILALAVSQQYFTLEDIAKKIVPSLCLLTIDPDDSVRENTFKTIKGFLGKLEKVSENPQLRQEMESEVMSTKKPVAGWAEWAVTALTSKITSKLTAVADASDDAAKTTDMGSLTKYDADLAADKAEKTSDMTFKLEENIEEDTGGWDDEDWGSLEETLKQDVEEKKVETVEKQRPKKENVRPVKKQQKNENKIKAGPMKLGVRLKEPDFL